MENMRRDVFTISARNYVEELKNKVKTQLRKIKPSSLFALGKESTKEIVGKLRVDSEVSNAAAQQQIVEINNAIEEEKKEEEPEEQKHGQAIFQR